MTENIPVLLCAAPYKLGTTYSLLHYNADSTSRRSTADYSCEAKPDGAENVFYRPSRDQWHQAGCDEAQITDLSGSMTRPLPA